MKKNREPKESLISRYLTLRFTFLEVQAVNAALCAAYVDYTMKGFWVENYLNPSKQKQMAGMAKKAIHKIDTKLAALMRLSPEQKNDIHKFCSQIDDDMPIEDTAKVSRRNQLFFDFMEV